MVRRKRPADAELAKVYDAQFEKKAKDADSKPGTAHHAGLRAVYDKGRIDETVALLDEEEKP